MYDPKADLFMRKLLAVSVLCFVMILCPAVYFRNGHRSGQEEEAFQSENEGAPELPADVGEDTSMQPENDGTQELPAGEQEGTDRSRAQIEDDLYEAEKLLSEGGVGDDALLQLADKLTRTGEFIDEIYSIQGVDEAQMEEYMTEDLNMLSVIYGLMARRDPDKRRSYYDLAAGCIEKLFKFDRFRESSVYEPKLLDLVSIKEELGEDETALEYLRSFETENPECSIDIYMAHACILLKDEGNKDEVRELYEKMSENEEFKKNFRYKELRRQMEVYLAAKK